MVQSRFEEGGIKCLKFVSVQAVGRHRRRGVCGGGFSATARCWSLSLGLVRPCCTSGASGTDSEMTSGLFMSGSKGNWMQHEALRLVRVFHDMNQTTLAERLEISKSYLSEIESGKKQVTLELLQKYADTFGMPLSSLLFFAEKIEGGARDRVRTAIAGKVVKMLDWIAAKDAA